MSNEVVALIIIAFFQAAQTVLLSMGTFIVKDMRDRITRLENIQMDKGFKTHV